MPVPQLVFNRLSAMCFQFDDAIGPGILAQLVLRGSGCIAIFRFSGSDNDLALPIAVGEHNYSSLVLPCLPPSLVA